MPVYKFKAVATFSLYTEQVANSLEEALELLNDKHDIVPTDVWTQAEEDTYRDNWVAEFDGVPEDIQQITY